MLSKGGPAPSELSTVAWLVLMIQVNEYASSSATVGILVMSAFFRLLACVAPSMVVAQSLGAFMLLVLVISSGFAIVRGDIPGWCETLWHIFGRSNHCFSLPKILTEMRCWLLKGVLHGQVHLGLLALAICLPAACCRDQRDDIAVLEHTGGHCKRHYHHGRRKLVTVWGMLPHHGCTSSVRFQL
jgi:hypothetical protein